MHKLHKPVAAISPSSLSEKLLMQIAVILYTKHTNGQSHWIATTDFQTCGCISVISLPTPIKEQLFWSPQSGELSDEKRCCFISFSYSLPSDGKALKRRDRKKKKAGKNGFNSDTAFSNTVLQHTGKSACKYIYSKHESFILPTIPIKKKKSSNTYCFLLSLNSHLIFQFYTKELAYLNKNILPSPVKV